MSKRLIGCISGAVASVLLALLLPRFFPPDAGFGQLCVLMALQEILLIGLPAVLLSMRSASSLAGLKRLWTVPNVFQSGLTMLMAVAFTLVSVLITVVFLSILQSIGVRPPLNGALVPKGPQQLMIAVLCAAIIPAVSEELLFRGLVQGTIASRFSQGAGIWGSALLFALLHRSVIAFPQMLAIGLALGKLRALSGGLILPIVFHAFYNFSVLVLNYSGAVPGFEMMLLCVFVFVISYRLFVKEGESGENQGDGF